MGLVLNPAYAVCFSPALLISSARWEYFMFNSRFGLRFLVVPLSVITIESSIHGIAAEENAPILTLRAGEFENVRLFHCVALSPDGKRIAADAQNGQVYLWDAATGKRELTIHTNSKVAVRGIALCHPATPGKTEKGFCHLFFSRR
jgi:WD40 repeat protein